MTNDRALHPKYEIATPMTSEERSKVMDAAVQFAFGSLDGSWVRRPIVSMGGTEMVFV